MNNEDNNAPPSFADLTINNIEGGGTVYDFKAAREAKAEKTDQVTALLDRLLSGSKSLDTLGSDALVSRGIVENIVGFAGINPREAPKVIITNLTPQNQVTRESF